MPREGPAASPIDPRGDRYRHAIRSSRDRETDVAKVQLFAHNGCRPLSQTR